MSTVVNADANRVFRDSDLSEQTNRTMRRSRN